MQCANRERGSALVVITILIVILAGLAGAFLATSVAGQKTSLATEDEAVCRQAAEAGLDKARRILYEVRESGGNWSQTLSACSTYFQASGFQSTGAAPAGGATNSGSSPYETYLLGSAPATAEDTQTGLTPQQFYGHNYTHGNAVYNVLVADDNDGDNNAAADANNQVVVFTTVAAPANPAPGQARRVLGTTRTVVYYEPPAFTPVNAITVGGGLILGGNPTIQGTNGSVHANGDVKIQGSPTISQSASATGTLTVTGNPPVPPGGFNAATAKVPIPKIDPDLYVNKAKYYLDSDGKVYDNATTPRTLIATGDWNGFSFVAESGWSRTAADPVPPPATIYINSNLKITGGGTDAARWQTTLLVKGSVDISGNPRMSPFEQNVSIVALGDVKIRGNANSQPGVNGLVATHEQVDIAGTPTFTGAIVAEDAADVYSLVSSVNQVGFGDEMFDQIMGNFDLTYNGGMQTFLIPAGVSVKVRSWERYK